MIGLGGELVFWLSARRRRRERARLAAGIERAIRDATGEPSRRGSAAPVDRAAVMGARTELQGLAQALRAGEWDGPGLLRARRLIVDGSSPLYSSDPEELARAADEARLAL